MGKVRILHPSSGHNNFNVVSNEAAANTDDGQTSKATNQSQGAAEVVDKKEIEEKTKDVITTVIASLPQTSSKD